MTHEQLSLTSPEEKLLSTPFELLEDVVEVEEEFRDAALEFTDTELAELYGDKESTVEKERTDKTLRNMGSVAFVMVMAPEFVETEMKKETLRVIASDDENSIATENGESGSQFAQDRGEYREYANTAHSIVAAALAGNEIAYSYLTPEFAELFRVRISSYDGEPSGYEFNAMISTVCIDLYRNAYGGKDPGEDSQSEYALAA